MEFVVLLPGQGSQRVGMGKDVHDAFPQARDVYREVDDAVNAPLSSLSFEGPADELTRTQNAQPALLAHSAAVWAVVRDAIAPLVRAAAGHSLGEFSAYHIAGACSLGDAARLVRRRGTLMLEQGTARPGAMVAIIGVLSTPIDAICAQASREAGVVAAANYNSNEQVVISGDVAGVERAVALAKDAGAKRCLPLPVSGAFHSPLMEGAAPGLAHALADVRWSDPIIPVVANVNAEVVRDATRAQALLLEQLTSSVQWTRVIHQLASLYPAATFLELGTGQVLTGLTRRIAPAVNTASCGTVTEIEQLLSSLGTNG